MHTLDSSTGWNLLPIKNKEKNHKNIGDNDYCRVFQDYYVFQVARHRVTDCRRLTAGVLGRMGVFVPVRRVGRVAEGSVGGAVAVAGAAAGPGPGRGAGGVLDGLVAQLVAAAEGAGAAVRRV